MILNSKLYKTYSLLKVISLVFYIVSVSLVLVSVGCVLVSVGCVPGEYVDSGTKQCTPCPLATYQDQGGQTECIPCSDGESTDGVGADSPDDCQGKQAAVVYYCSLNMSPSMCTFTHLIK